MFEFWSGLNESRDLNQTDNLYNEVQIKVMKKKPSSLIDFALIVLNLSGDELVNTVIAFTHVKPQFFWLNEKRKTTTLGENQGKYRVLQEA